MKAQLETLVKRVEAVSLNGAAFEIIGPEFGVGFCDLVTVELIDHKRDLHGEIFKCKILCVTVCTAGCAYLNTQTTVCQEVE